MSRDALADHAAGGPAVEILSGSAAALTDSVNRLGQKGFYFLQRPHRTAFGNSGPETLYG